MHVHYIHYEKFMIGLKTVIILFTKYKYNRLS